MTIPSSLFIVINILIIVLYIFLIIQAYRKGFLYELLSFLGFVLSFFISWFISPILAEHFPIFEIQSLQNIGEELMAVMFVPILNNVIWFLIVLIIVRIIIGLLLSIFKSISKLPIIGFFNRLLGSVFGLINATIWVLIFSVLLSMPFFANGQEIKENTLIKHINNLSNEALLFISEHIGDDLLKGAANEFGDIDEARAAFVIWMQEQGIIHE